ncbi:uncharacterized protein [Dendrobates tinctorius]|uniref:uncharacterized protein isoform X1 n=1 Tax=Dendrobates tinctorius TaxID=92724 RepID=UPI003CC93903
MWVHPHLRQRLTKDHFHRLYAALRTNPDKFFLYCRMTVSTFDVLLDTVRPGITFQDTQMRKCISAEERLLLTLRFLTTGLSYAALHLEFLIGQSTISGIVRATCLEILSRLNQLVRPEPKMGDWLRIARGFESHCQFPICIGALDGKHIRVRKPPNSGSQFYNYKQYFSVVLLALVDSNYRFIIVDIGAYGRTGDSRVFNSSIMGRRLRNNQLDLPPPRQLPGSNQEAVPYVLVGDEAFQLTRHVMRPYPSRNLDHCRRIFNLRLSRARRLVECAFSILCAKWRVLQTVIQLSEANVNEVIKACVVLHNFTRLHDCSSSDVTEGVVDNGDRPRPHVLPLWRPLSGLKLYDAFPWLMYHLPGPQQAMYKHMHFLKQYMLQEIRQHQQNPSPEPQDVVDYYLEEILKVKDDPASTISEGNLVRVLMDLLLAGSETVTSTLKWGLLYMAIYQDVQVKVQKEIDAFVESIENLQYEDRIKMPYTNAVIHEVQRFSNVAPVGLPRQCTQDIKLNEYSIRKGSIVIANLASVLTEPKHWKFPDTFNPSNFLDEEENFQSNKAFVPFSAGHRICMGEQMARTELFIFFTSLLKTLSFHLPKGVTEVNLNGIFGTTFKPHPYQICAIPR